MKLKKVILIDGNSLGYASHHTTKLHVGDQEVQAIFHCIKTMRKLLRTYSSYTPIILWDKHTQWRFDLHPMYKDGRDDTPEKVAERKAYHDQKPYIFKCLHLLGIGQLSAEEYEADDLAGYLTKHFTDQDIKVMLVTGDQDWIQLVSDKCVWYDTIRDKTVNANNFAEFTGYINAQYFVEGKALQGDGSDTIPGVGGIGAKGAPEFIMQYGGVARFLQLADEGKLPEKLPKVISRFANNEVPPASKKYGELLPVRDGFERNMKLMDLRNAKKPSAEATNAVKGKFNRAKFEELCGELAFQSILNNMDTWIQPFEEKANG
ncbi:MAG: 5'-3' exonuclease [Piscirickettsiaceae bacterium]|nr:5'-3' exonuclease [Piscirickettsiaceae bacterium]